MRDSTAQRLSALHTRIFRITKGRIGRRLVNNDMLLLTTTGRRTGAPRTVPLLYLTAGKSLVVVASWGGRTNHPLWYENLREEAEVVVQVLGETSSRVARTATEDERAEWWPRVLSAHSGYAEYQSRTDRQIPIVFLDPS